MLRSFARQLLPTAMRPREIAMREALRSCGARVAAGPFAGLSYLAPREHDWYFPQLLGSYEVELRPVVARWLEGLRGGTVIVAGAAEGYYAVGLARFGAPARVVAFEANDDIRARLASTAELNGVRLEIGGLCTGGALRRELERDPGARLVCDIEGGEALLLDPELLPELAGVEMLVETHDFTVPGVDELLRGRFAPTHRIVEIAPRARSATDLPPIELRWRRRLEAAYVSLLAEGRPPGCRWLHLQPERGVRG